MKQQTVWGWVLAPILVLAPVNTRPAAAVAPEHSVAHQEVVVVLPGAQEARRQENIRFSEHGEGQHFDLYLPAGEPAGDGAEPLPVVIFANGGDRPGRGSIKKWPAYRGWARLVTTRGLAAVTHENLNGRAGLQELLDYLRDHSGELGLDGERLLVWACSGHVSIALPYLQEDMPAGVRATVAYYGGAQVERFDPELPVFSVRAGLDRPVVNDSIDALWEAALDRQLPWTLVNAPGLHHAFDVLDDRGESRQLVRQTLDFLELHSRSSRDQAAPRPLARAALAHWFAREWELAAEAYRRYGEVHPGDATAFGRQGIALVRSGLSARGIEVLHRALALGYDADSAHFEQGSRPCPPRAVQRGGGAPDPHGRQRCCPRPAPGGRSLRQPRLPCRLSGPERFVGARSGY